jgi:6-phosphogluconolactonase (cycloisomerase 2 family)
MRSQILEPINITKQHQLNKRIDSIYPTYKGKFTMSLTKFLNLKKLESKTIYRVLATALLMALALVQPKVTLAHSNAGRIAGATPEQESMMQQSMMEAEVVGTAYVLTNQLTGNGVAIFDRFEDGSLSEPTVVATGGQGIGAGLGSQGSIALSEDGQWLVVVNAGSDEISLLEISEDGLTLADKVASGGVRPTSVTIYDDLVYVLNAGASGNIAGFHLSDEGKLMPIAGSTRHLSNLGLGESPTPGQIAFDPKGEVLVVTERASNMISLYQVGKDGMAYGPMVQEAAGMTPYGFAFTPKGTLVVSEAFGGDDNASAVSSYAVSKDGFMVVSASVPTGQTAACWITLSKDGKFAYSANAGSSSISSYRVGTDGSLTLLDGAAGMTGDDTGPLDMRVSDDGSYLYALSARSQNIIAFAIQADGSLESLGAFGGLPMGSYGLAVR